VTATPANFNVDELAEFEAAHDLIRAQTRTGLGLCTSCFPAPFEGVFTFLACPRPKIALLSEWSVDACGHHRANRGALGKLAPAAGAACCLLMAVFGGCVEKHTRWSRW